MTTTNLPAIAPTTPDEADLTRRPPE
jgi:hypothetical protein